ncbi:OmpA family protein [Hymenobacter sp. NST-14]|uniref:OmpA family protein n=1 Tax=Hymenobacter piscis TaxID=2839984 RepID=UPI001C017FC8|nr:OmpA family protein [Hymenobacter piscis]MBT9392930.1 OmpA family protein [Hymenobacter piscis]
MLPRIPFSRVLALGVTACTLAPQLSQAQTADRKTAIGLNVSAMQYKGNFGSDYWDFSENKYAPGITFSRYLSKGLDVQLSGNYVEFKKDAPNGAPYFGSRFATNVVNVNLGLKFKLFNDDSPIRPYLLAAPGLTYTSREGTIFRNNQTINTDEDKNHFDLFGAAGIDFRLGDAVTLFVQTGQHVPLNANIDGDPARDDNKGDDRFLQHTVGLNIALGKAKDEDGDGVSDKKDKCPGTPAGVAVDLNGCPLDGDGDGVPDYLDKCPTEKGLANLEGCPDRDGDGIRDSEDQCPDTPGKAELQGCPDADNDGVIDSADKCPDTPGGVKVDANGCPLDGDGDGVPDFQDRCPNRPGPASNKGCPEMKLEEKQRLQEATKYIQFEFNKAALKPSSFPTLDLLVKIMNDYPDYYLGISAHADSKGDNAYNLRLSDDRAASAREYMLRKGVSADRIVSHGYGESKPIATNDTDAGRAINRRVEFDVYLPGDPNPAEVKYGPAPEIPAQAPEAPKQPVRKVAPRKVTGKRK